MRWQIKVHFFFRDGNEHIIERIYYITNGEFVFNLALLKGTGLPKVFMNPPLTSFG